MADPLIIKICGIKTPDILETAIEAGADLVGFMHFARSPRHVDIETLQTLISEARGRVETCVVLVNPDNSCVMEVAALSPDWIK
jgi:phosphoribosylanthranilate isomerase